MSQDTTLNTIFDKAKESAEMGRPYTNAYVDGTDSAKAYKEGFAAGSPTAIPFFEK